MDATIYAALNLVKAFITTLTNLEGQDTVLTLDGAEAMLTDIQSGSDIDVDYYVGHYCDVLDGQADKERIAAYVRDEQVSMPNPYDN